MELNTELNSKEQQDKYSNLSKKWSRLGTGAYYSEYEQKRFEDALTSVSTNLVEELEKGNLFARWSPDIEQDKHPEKKSKSVSIRGVGDKPLEEPGISVYTLNKKLTNFGLNRRYDMTGVEGYRPRKLYVLRGSPVNLGHDSEWLLDPASIETVLTVPYECKILEDFPELKYHTSR